MKAIWFSSLAVLVAIGLSGCDTKGTPGGSGVSNTKPIIGQSDDSFSLKPPLLSTKLHQGETKAFSIGISRGKNFSEDVSLKFENLPQGVTIEPASPSIKHGDEEAKLSLKAAADAAVGDFNIKVIGHPAKGPDAANELKVTVEKK